MIITVSLERHDAFLAGISRNVLRAEAEGRFKHKLRVAGQMPGDWRDVRHTMIANAVHSLYRVLETTEAP